MIGSDPNIVSYKVAKFLKDKLGYSRQTVYVYENERLKISFDPVTEETIHAPEVLDAVDFLRSFGIFIYYIPEKDLIRGIVHIGPEKYRMKKPMNSVYSVYSCCLNFVSKYF